MLKKSLVALTLFFLIAPTIASADMISPQEKRVDYCVEISNLNSYPDYEFILGSSKISEPGIYEPEESPQVIYEGGCFRFYKFAKPSIYAIKKSVMAENSIDLNYISQYQEKHRFEENRDFFKEHSSLLVPSAIRIQSVATIPVNSPLKGIVDVLEVVSLNDDKLEIRKAKVIYTYTDGTTEELAYQSQDVRPKPSQEPFLPWWFFGYILGLCLTILVEFAIIYLFIRKNPLQLLLYSFLINLLTLPSATYIFNKFSSSLLSLIVLEIAVFLVESLLLTRFLKIKYKKALLISFITNLLTSIMGVLLVIFYKNF